MKVLPVMGTVLVSFPVTAVNDSEFRHLLLTKSRDRDAGRNKGAHTHRG